LNGSFGIPLRLETIKLDGLVLFDARVTHPILALTPHAGPEMSEQCFAGGVDHFLTKPIQLRKLFETLQTVETSQPRR